MEDPPTRARSVHPRPVPSCSRCLTATMLIAPDRPAAVKRSSDLRCWPLGCCTGLPLLCLGVRQAANQPTGCSSLQHYYQAACRQHQAVMGLMALTSTASNGPLCPHPSRPGPFPPRTTQALVPELAGAHWSNNSARSTVSTAGTATPSNAGAPLPQQNLQKVQQL